MIIKRYKPDGSPDLTRWTVRCDLPGCGHTHPLMGSHQWLIPAIPAMPTYCPVCALALAALLISTVLACPCGSTDLRIYHDQDLTPEGLRYAACADCGLVLVTNDPQHPGGIL